MSIVLAWRSKWKYYEPLTTVPSHKEELGPGLPYSIIHLQLYHVELSDPKNPMITRFIIHHWDRRVNSVNRDQRLVTLNSAQLMQFVSDGHLGYRYKCYQPSQNTICINQWGLDGGVPNRLPLSPRSPERRQQCWCGLVVTVRVRKT